MKRPDFLYSRRACVVFSGSCSASAGHDRSQAEERDHRDRVDREDQAAPDQLRPDPPSRSAVECSIIFVVPLRQAKASKVVRRWGACSARG